MHHHHHHHCHDHHRTLSPNIIVVIVVAPVVATRTTMTRVMLMTMCGGHGRSSDSDINYDGHGGGYSGDDVHDSGGGHDVPPFNSPLIVQFLRISSSQLHYESTPQGITVARIISRCRPACAHLRHTLASFTAASTEESRVYIILAAPPQHAQICDDKLAHENLTSKEIS
ncbi:hypothetical protein D0Y65_048320 [Glycine soja]|uniref:Uncharacterized protein n=2 Tax=Glycine soja TaxID=3848 RepID=A0A445FSG7_GLYSO|nr:hypothetical protein D0Y65_048320 [Glycine soja]